MLGLSSMFIRKWLARYVCHAPPARLLFNKNEVILIVPSPCPLVRFVGDGPPRAQGPIGEGAVWDIIRVARILFQTL